MQIPATLWTILVQNKRFDGIKPTPSPNPNPDGSYTVTLTVTQWKVFEENQKKPPVPVPAEPEPSKPAPGKEPEEKPGEEITVTLEPSMFRPLSSITLNRKRLLCPRFFVLL